MARARMEALETRWRELKDELDLDLWKAPETQFRASWDSFCRELGECFPDELVAALTARKYESLNLNVDDPLSLPWARARLGDDSLIEGWSFSRDADLVITRQDEGKPKALVISNPDGLMPSVDTLFEGLVKMLETRFETEFLSGSQATLENVRRSLSRPHSLLLASGYLETGPLNNTLQLTDGSFSFNEFQSQLKTPQLMILNVIFPSAFDNEHLAKSLLKHGCQSLVMPSWPAPGTGDMIRSTLLSMAEGSPLAKSVRLSRADWQRQDSRDAYLSQHALDIWGVPDTRLRVARERSVTVETALTTLYTLSAKGPDFELEFPIFEQALLSGKRLYLGKPGPMMNQLEIPDPGVPNRVAYFEYAEKGLHLVALTSDLKLNGLPVRESAGFTEGDVIEVGQTQLVFKSEQARHTEVGSSKAKLKVLAQGSNPERVYEVQENLVLVGRGSQCQLQLMDAAVSRVQFVLIERSGDYFLAPVSSNPTIVNGVAVNREIELLPGAEVRLSEDTVLHFEQGSSRVC